MMSPSGRPWPRRSARRGRPCGCPIPWTRAGRRRARPGAGRTLRGPGQGQVADEAARAGRFHHQPAGCGPHDISADRRQERRGERVLPPVSEQALLVQPAGRAFPPGGSGAVGPAGQPAFLPCRARLFLQPVQQERQPPAADLLGVGVAGREWRMRQPFLHLSSALPGRWPGRERGPGRETSPRCLPARRYRPRQQPRFACDDGHDAPFRNSTSSVSGRYPGAGAGRARAAACRVCSR